MRFTDPSGHAVDPPPCAICDMEPVDISGWSELAQGLAVVGCILLGCHVDYERAIVSGPTYEEWLQDQATSLMSMPAATVGGRFAKAGIKVTDHFLGRLVQRGSRGISEAAALRAYNRGRLCYNPATKNYIRHDSTTGISVVVDKPSGGTAITVFEGNPSPDWVHVPWRPGN